MAEKKIDGGMVEELIVQAQDELSLAAKANEWKMWSDLEEHPVRGQWKWP